MVSRSPRGSQNRPKSAARLGQTLSSLQILEKTLNINMSPLQRPGEFSGCKFEAVIKPFQSSLFDYPSVVE